jgi:hypothetical protein
VRLTWRQVQTNLGLTALPDEESSPIDAAPPDGSCGAAQLIHAFRGPVGGVSVYSVPWSHTYIYPGGH